MKRPDLLVPVARWMISGAALRPIARGHDTAPATHTCHPSTVARLARRIGSQALLLLDEARRDLLPVAEPIVFDHFETFVGMQENALGILTAVGRGSWYTYGLEPAWHRRSTAGSRRAPRVARTPGAYRRSVSRMVEWLRAGADRGGTLHLISDDHPAYPRAIRGTRAEVRIVHEVHANPKSRRRGERRTDAARVRDAAMFAVDLEHRWIRHVCADHRRESIAFCRRGEAAMERLAVFAVWRNFVQGVSVRRSDRTTPAMRVGLADRPWGWEEVLGRRRWPGRVGSGPTVRTVVGRSMREPRRGVRWPAHVRRRAL